MKKEVLLKMTGQQLFDYYTDQAGEYGQILFTAHQMINDDIFPMLEKAEKENKKVALKTINGDVDDPIIEVVIE